MKEILKTIVAHKKNEVEQQKKVVSEAQILSELQNIVRPRVSMRLALENSPTGIIAEFKRRSPSKGWINQSASVREVVADYRQAGATACSVLTDSEFFGGSLDDLIQARAVVGNSLPLLRKEFIIDPYQIIQARAAGADAILLIASCLSVEQCAELVATASEMKLEVLLEIHSPQELSYFNSQVDMLGVNNRNLDTFHTDIDNSFQLVKVIKSHISTHEKQPLLISESGITDAQTINRLRDVGFRGFLIGETFIKSSDPKAALANLIQQIR